MRQSFEKIGKNVQKYKKKGIERLINELIINKCCGCIVYTL